MSTEKISSSFYQQQNVLTVARSLVGKILCSQVDDHLCKVKITETEAYRSWGDKACHAHQNRFTKRTAVMFEPGGIAYVYLCYGIHALFNIVTNSESVPEAVLIRSGEPVMGESIMQDRRGAKIPRRRLSVGPGNLTQALGITTKHNREALNGDIIWLEEPDSPPLVSIATSPRIGIDYAGADAQLPFRFFDQNSAFVS